MCFWVQLGCLFRFSRWGKVTRGWFAPGWWTRCKGWDQLGDPGKLRCGKDCPDLIERFLTVGLVLCVYMCVGDWLCEALDAIPRISQDRSVLISQDWSEKAKLNTLWKTIGKWTQIHISRLELWWKFVRPTWSLACEKNIFYMHANTKLKKIPHIEIQNNF